MTTKEKLINDRESSKVAFLKLKQKYNPSSNKIYLIVEGKDDIAYYSAISTRYPYLNDSEIISANNRSNVIHTYNSIDWTVYSKKRILFFIDRDLSDLTNEYTPSSPNIYVTDNYSIENSLFNEQLLFTTLRIFCGLEELNDEESKTLSELYHAAVNNFEEAFLPIMAWILYWRLNGQKCNLNNLNNTSLYSIDKGTFKIKPEYADNMMLESTIHSCCGVVYSQVDIKDFKERIINCGGISKFIRGKYVRTFFVKFINSIVDSIPYLLTGRKTPKAIITFGQGNILQLLCGYMMTPDSLNTFLININT